MASDDMVLAIAATGVLVVLVGFLWHFMQKQGGMTKARLQRVETVNRLIEKFPTAKEVIDFLETEQGRKLLEDPLPPTTNPLARVLRFIRYGVVFLFLGSGFLLDAYWLRGETEIRYISQAKDMQFWGAFCLALGAGLVMAGVITNVLIKRWARDGEKEEPRAKPGASRLADKF